MKFYTKLFVLFAIMFTFTSGQVLGKPHFLGAIDFEVETVEDFEKEAEKNEQVESVKLSSLEGTNDNIRREIYYQHGHIYYQDPDIEINLRPPIG